jgi:peroxiredoxin
MFKDKNFTVVGISLDKEKKYWMEAIQHDSLTWTQLSDLKYWDSQIAELYGVRGIPANVLINPQGVILARNVMGEDLIDALSKELNKDK